QQRQKLEIHHLKHRVGQLQAENIELTEQMEVVQDQNVDLQNTVAELDNQLQQMLLNDEINLQIQANAEEEEEEPIEIQGESDIASGFIDEPRYIDGAHVVLANELSDAESSVNQPYPAAPAAH